MAEGKTYNIPATRFEWFKAQLDTLGRKAKKLNGERLFCTVVGFHTEEDKQSRWVGQKIMEVFVACPEPKLNGWDFVARIDHAYEAGNIVRNTGLHALPEEYRERGPVCDHCGHKRMRRDTFVVFKEGEGYKQVGSSCLKDFLGHGDADRIAKLAELLANIHSFMRGSYEFDDAAGLVNRSNILMSTYLAHVAQQILTYGFISKKQAFETNRDSTAELALINYNSRKPISMEAADLAAMALAWAESLDETQTEPLNDYLHNAWVVANAPMIEPRSTGIAASIVGVYYRNNQPKALPSAHVGVVGEKLEIEVEVLDTRRLDTGSTLVTMRDRSGNCLKWFATGKAPLRGVQQRISATVKAHNTFKGKHETILTRCKAAR